MSKYDDIINLNRPISKHPHLSDDSRASQFAPFAALTGYDDAVKETARLTDKQIEISEEVKKKLNIILSFINDNLNKDEKYTITYFVRDGKKDGGKYLTQDCFIKKINSVDETIKLTDNTILSMSDVIDITSEKLDKMFSEIENNS